MTQSRTEQQMENNDGKGIWSNLKAFFRLRVAPDTTRELESEIQELLEEGEEQGLISSQEERMISSIFDFRETVASEIMTPSAEMITADCTSSVEELIRLVIEEGYTRIPLYDGRPDTIVGILHAKDLLCFCAGEDYPAQELRQRLRPPVFIRESIPIIDLLRDFQEKKNHMAIVTDEFGGVRGLVTLEDVIEEIVGEITDEHDQEESELRVVSENVILVDAKIDIEQVEQFFNCRLPEGPYESVGGLILYRLAQVPDRGAVVAVADLIFTVVSADKRRVKTVRIEQKG
ncbi:MAG TPA: HlyC/CorC family transporter [Desulfobulbaceae bacterium]|nr:HlyC/CorC family transporter [Desulfobulbaceae bacterium]